MSEFQETNNIRQLDETDLYVLLSEYEDTFLVEKKTNKELWRTSFYGDAECGLIGLTQDWAVVGGEHVALWVNGKLTVIEDEDLKWIHDIRQIGDYEIEILIDPWSENSAIWRFDVLSQSKIKVRDFDDYKGKASTDNVEW